MYFQFGMFEQTITGPAAHLLLADGVRSCQLNVVALDGWKNCLDFLNAEVILFLLVTEQQARSKHVKRVTPALTVDNLRDAVQRLCIGVGVWVGEILHDFTLPVTQGSGDFLEVGGEVFGDHLRPLTDSQLSVSAIHLVDVEKRFLDLVCLIQFGDVLQPAIKVKGLFVGQVLGTLEQHMSAAHQYPSATLWLIVANSLSDPIHAAIDHSDDVVLINHNSSIRNDRSDQITIRTPHIDSDALNIVLAGQVIKPAFNDRPVSDFKKVNRSPVANVSENTPETASNVYLINPQPLRGVDVKGAVQIIGVDLSDTSDSLFIATNVPGNIREGVLEALLLDVLTAPDSHSTVCIDFRDWLQERALTVPAFIPLNTGNKDRVKASDRAIPVPDLLSTVLIEPANDATYSARVGLNTTGGINNVFVTINGGTGYIPARQIQYVRHSSITHENPNFRLCHRHRITHRNPKSPKKYGKLGADWREDLKAGFSECFRVLKPNSTLIFKWNETHIPVSQILALTDLLPLFGHKTGRQAKTHWICFFKNGGKES